MTATRPTGRRADALAAAVVALGVYLLFGNAFLNYDSFYSLQWGTDALKGDVPEYERPLAPTPHPLLIAVGGGLGRLFGNAAEELALALVLLGFGALVVGVFRLGERLFSWPVGLLAAAIVVTRVPFLSFGIRGYVDLVSVALIVWAGVLEAERPRRGAPMLVLLGVAGLLRPEAWLFAAAYWLWLAPGLDWGGRARAGALAAAAPLLWMASDLAVTSDPLWSLNGTSDNAALLQRPTGLDDVPEVLPRRLGEIVRLPELIASVVGLAAGLAWLRERLAIPLALGALNGVAYLVFAVAGLPLLGRYLFLAASMLALLAALAALGWTALPEAHPARRRWQLGGLVVALAIVVFFPVQVGRISDLRADIERRDRVQADLRDLGTSETLGRAFHRCKRMYLPNHRNVPQLSFWTGHRPSEFASAQLERPAPLGLFVAPANREVERLSILDPRDPRRFDARVPDRYRPVARNRSWVLWAGCPGPLV